jgi:hypothetical protein
MSNQKESAIQMLTLDADREKWKELMKASKKKRARNIQDNDASNDNKRNKSVPSIKDLAKQVSQEARDAVERGEFTFDSRPYSQYMRQSAKAAATSLQLSDMAAGPAENSEEHKPMPAWHLAIPQPLPTLWEAIHSRFHHIRNDPTAPAGKDTDALQVGDVVVLRDAPDQAVPEKFKDRAVTITEVHPDRFKFVHEGVKKAWYLDYTQAVPTRGACVEPDLLQWLSSAAEEIKCGHRTIEGRFCNWSAPCRIHHKRERTAMEIEDELSRKRDRGICNVKTRQGKICTNANECPSHAPDLRRCTSMIDDNHDLHCWNFKSKEEEHSPEYCVYHQDFPNLSVNAREYGLTGKVCSVEDFLSHYYPDSGDKNKLPMDSSTLFKKYVALMSDQKELWWADYNPYVSTEFKTQAKKIVNELFPMRGDAKTHAARSNHTLSDQGSRLRVQTNGDSGGNGDKFMVYMSSLSSGGEGVSVASTVAYVMRM